MAVSAQAVDAGRAVLCSSEQCRGHCQTTFGAARAPPSSACVFSSASLGDARGERWCGQASAGADAGGYCGVSGLEPSVSQDSAAA